ncbi:TonB-dependent receptor [Sphingomonas sp.]|uniref:TonB-dependent receptor plug domain-containing protein n=1 Tax=Sphingomonas sp. TaxID=28214 RepID=UPI002CA99044|nr:TonB-dependent receptor [Sphingomonas sp.]HTG38025.1 TonB-dependent receptor [Sphingomonas sp.]
MTGLSIVAILAATAQPAPVPAAGTDGQREQAIVVTGTRTPRTIREAPVRTDVIGPALLERAAPRNLADAIDFLPAARSESNCQNCNTTEIQLLGLPGAYNQILLDGLPLVTGVAAVYGVEQIPAVLVDRIEVVKGGASALYGPGAVAGVVNVIPTRPERDMVRVAVDTQRAEGRQTAFGSLLGARTFAQGFINIFAQADYSPAIDLNDDGYSELARRRLVTAGTRGEWQPDEGTTIAIDYQFTAEQRRGGNLLDRPAHLANITEQIDSEVHRGSINVTQMLGPDTRLIGTYAVSQLARHSFYGGLGEVETDPDAPGFDPDALADATAISRNQYGRTADTFHYGEIRLETLTGAHALLGGVQYRAEKVRDRGEDVDGNMLLTIVDGRFSTIGGFVQDEWTLSDSLRLVLGGRVDQSSELDDFIVSPRIGLWASPSPALVLRANYSTGYRAPEVFSEDIHVDVLGAAPIGIVNTTGLVAERADSFALGFDWRPTWRDGAFTLDGQAYLTKLRDTFFLGELETAANGALFRTRSNAGGSQVAGAEINITYRFSPTLNASVGAAYIDARYDDEQVVFDDGATVLATHRYLKSPRLAGVVQMVWRTTPSFDAFLAARYTGSMDVLNNRLGAIQRSPDYLVLDLTGTRHFPVGDDNREIDVTFGIRNLTDARQRDLETGAARDSDYVYGPRLPRAFFVRINARL